MMKRLLHLTARTALCITLLMPSLLHAQTEPRRIDRYRELYSAKNLVLTTTKKTEHFYLVSSSAPQLIQLSADSFSIAGDRFAKADVQAMRFTTLPKFILNEDSTEFSTRTVNHGLLAFRRTLSLGLWNTLVVPFDMTGRQLRDAFGADAQLAKVSGIRTAESTIVEFDTIDVATNDVVVQAGVIYLLRPTREPDIAADKRLTQTYDNVRGLYGPFYMIPNVSIGKSTRVTSRLYTSDDEETSLRMRGTYLKLDNSVTSGRTIRNKKALPGSFVLGPSGRFEQHEDSVTIPAFQAWFEVNQLSEDTDLHFFVNGIEEDITSLPDAIIGIAADEHLQRRPTSDAVYDLMGRKVADHAEWPLADMQLPRGIYIINGKKYIKN